MDFELTFEEFNPYTEQLLTPLKGEDRIKLFRQMYLKIYEILPEAIVRGRNEEIVGVSNPGERFVFYIGQKDNEYIIKFQNQKAEPFLIENSEELLRQAKEYALLRLSNPEMFLIKGKKNDKKKLPEVSLPKAAPIDIQDDITGAENQYEISDNRAFYLRFDVNPEDYRDVYVSRELFPMRVYHCLMRNGIETVEQLLMQHESQLLVLKNFGRQSMKQTVDALHSIIEKQNGGEESGTEETDDLPEETDGKILSLGDLIRECREQTGNTILSYAGMVQSQDVLDSQCEDFVCHLKAVLLPFLDDIPIIEGRNKEIFIEWLMEKKTLAVIGKEYNLSRQRIRQISEKQERRILGLIRRYPTETTVENLIRFSAVLTEQDPEVLFVYLKYLKNRYQSLYHLIEDVFFFSHTNEKRELINNCVSSAPNSRLKPRPIRPEKVPYVAPIPVEKKCPRCGSQLVIYTARRGTNPGRQFVGCSQFPRCRYSADIIYLERGTNKVIE